MRAIRVGSPGRKAERTASFDLSDRVALVTGANTGLGQAIAIGLAGRPVLERAPGTYRDGYPTNVPDRDGNAIEGVVDTFDVDMAASLQITDRLQPALEGVNLTDEVPTQCVGVAARVSVHHDTGR